MKNTKPSSLVVKSNKLIPKHAVIFELGAGPLNDAKYLINQGHLIVAIDKSPMMIELVKKLKTNEIGIGLYKKISFEKYNYPQKLFDLVSAQWSLYFIKKKDFNETFSKIRKSLKKGGIFTGHFLGKDDDWNTKKGITTHTKKEVQNLFNSFKIIYWHEERVLINKKHWHVYWVIAKKN